MRKKLILFIAGLTLLCTRIFAQSPVSVSPLTGALNVAIPVYTVNSGGVSLPITLYYNGSGVKPTDVEATAGINWQLNAGGQVSRQVRGLPDDVSQDAQGNSRLGWMNAANTGASNIGSFVIQNDGVTCSKETADIANINTSYPYTNDTEPDIFSVNAPGLSCQLIYDRTTSKFLPLKYQDLVITYSLDALGLINSFTITNDRGIKYVFAAPESVTQFIDSWSPTYFSMKLKQYQYGINYNDSWSLTSITDPNGNGVILDYSVVRPRSSSDSLRLYMPGATTATLQYTVQQAVTSQLIKDIKTTNILGTQLAFTFTFYNTNSYHPTGQTFINNMTGMGHQFVFNYDAMSTAGGTYRKSFLRSFRDAGCSSPVNYQFTYAKENLSAGTTLLPDSGTHNVDYWGYYANNGTTTLQPKIAINPATAGFHRYTIYQPVNGTPYTYNTANGNGRYADPVNGDAGSLNGITYAEGGTTTIVYESNSYIDAASGQEVKGGGVRVKQVTDNDNSNPPVIRNYTYTDSATAATSGKPVTLPEFAFTVPYSGTATGSSLWNSNTVVSDYDLSTEDHSILYQYFKESVIGMGSTQYQYYLPAMNWDNNATPGCSGCTTNEWAPTTNFVARNNCASAYGPVGNSTYNYPFIPNPNYDIERGLLQKTVSYNDAGAEVSESTYTYQRSYAPSVITALKYDDNPNGSLLVRGYNKYLIYYNTSELTSQVVKKVFDSPTLTQAQTSTANYVYGSSAHKLLTQQSVTNSDNSMVTTNFRYVKDYTATAGSNPNVNAIYYLQQQNSNVPVETWQQVTRGGNTVTTGASLTLYQGVQPFSATLYLPATQFKLVQPDGIPSASSPDAFTPFSISGQTTAQDSRYFPTANYDSYDVTGYPVTVDNTYKQIQTTVLDHTAYQPVAAFANAAINEVAFNDFDTDLPGTQNYNFTISGSGSFAANGSHTGNAYGLGSSQTLTKTISKNGQAQNYIFSIWINAAAAGSLTFTLTGGNTSTYTKTYNTGGWTYYEWKIPVTNMSATFTVNITSSQAISIDDVLFYPDAAQVATSSYDKVSHIKTSDTNTNGVSAYYQTDQWGRLLYKYDQDKNIVEKKSYFTTNQAAPSLSSLTYSATPFNGPASSPVVFVASVDCVTGVSYAWDFGDGTTIPATLNGNNQSHTYASAGNYNVTVTATRADLATQTYSNTVNIQQPSISPQVCVSGVTSWNSCTGVAIRTATCGSNPTSNTESYYTINSVPNAIGTITYQWMISYNNGVNWSPDGSNTNQYVVGHDQGSLSYQVKCVVSTSGGQQATSNIVQLTAVPCH